MPVVVVVVMPLFALCVFFAMEREWRDFPFFFESSPSRRKRRPVEIFA